MKGLQVRLLAPHSAFFILAALILTAAASIASQEWQISGQPVPVLGLTAADPAYANATAFLKLIQGSETCVSRAQLRRGNFTFALTRERFIAGFPNCAMDIDDTSYRYQWVVNGRIVASGRETPGSRDLGRGVAATLLSTADPSPDGWTNDASDVVTDLTLRSEYAVGGQIVRFTVDHKDGQVVTTCSRDVQLYGSKASDVWLSTLGDHESWSCVPGLAEHYMLIPSGESDTYRWSQGAHVIAMGTISAHTTFRGRTEGIQTVYASVSSRFPSFPSVITPRPSPPDLPPALQRIQAAFMAQHIASCFPFIADGLFTTNAQLMMREEPSPHPSPSAYLVSKDLWNQLRLFMPSWAQRPIPAINDIYAYHPGLHRSDAWITVSMATTTLDQQPYLAWYRSENENNVFGLMLLSDRNSIRAALADRPLLPSITLTAQLLKITQSQLEMLPTRSRLHRCGMTAESFYYLTGADFYETVIFGADGQAVAVISSAGA